MQEVTLERRILSIAAIDSGPAIVLDPTLRFAVRSKGLLDGSGECFGRLRRTKAPRDHDRDEASKD